MRGKASSGVALVLGKTFHFAGHMTAIMVLKRFFKNANHRYIEMEAIKVIQMSFSKFLNERVQKRRAI